MTRWLVTGAAGMLGRDLTNLLQARGEEFTPLARADLNITDQAAVAKAVSLVKPDVVVNCAAWTAVDAAEEREEEAFAINAHGAANLAAACASAGALLVHPSTDYVFDGHASAPYAEDAPTAPAGAYGRTKLAGEQAVRAALPDASYIVRTAWLYGAHGKNFLKTMLRLARNGTAPGVVADQHGQPTWTADVAAQIYALIDKSAPTGIYHATSAGQTTWFGFAEEIFTLYQGHGQGQDQGQEEDSERLRLTPRPVTTADYPTPAKRPAYSVLGHEAWRAAGIAPISDWKDALHRAFPAILANADA
ncbi:MAG: dTDP-4-dehydrorhamnose reductase [Trebonia sp.]|nr:dTDP-4-dehydrorhamnose reductase [Trebonia sp.]